MYKKATWTLVVAGLVLLGGPAYPQIDMPSKDATMAQHVVVNKVLLAYGFDVYEAEVGEDGIHKFLVVDRKDGLEFNFFGNASLREVESRRQPSTHGERIDVDLVSEDGTLHIWMAQETGLSDNGRVFHSSLTASQMHDGSVSLDSVFWQNQSVQLVEGATDLSSIESYLAGVEPGISVKLETITTTGLGMSKTTTLVHQQMVKQEDGTVIVDYQTTEADHAEFAMITTEERWSECASGCGSTAASVLLAYNMRITRWSFDLEANEPVQASSEYVLADWASASSSSEAGNPVTVQTKLSLASTNREEELIISTRSTTTIDGVQIKTQSHQEVMRDGFLHTAVTHASAIDPAPCPPGEIDAGGWCMPSGEAQPLISFGDVFGHYAGSAFSALGGSVAVCGALGLAGGLPGAACLVGVGLGVGITVGTITDAVIAGVTAPPSEANRSIPCDQKVDIWTCRSDLAMDTLREGYSLSVGREVMLKEIPVEPEPELLSDEELAALEEFRSMQQEVQYVGYWSGSLEFEGASYSLSMRISSYDPATGRLSVSSSSIGGTNITPPSGVIISGSTVTLQSPWVGVTGNISGATITGGITLGSGNLFGILSGPGSGTWWMNRR